jgi:tetratricopeptide (TPR) repeat protein
LKQKTSEISNACIIEIKGNLGDFYSIKGMVLKSIEMYKDAGELILKYPEEFTRLPRYTHYRDNIKHWYCDTSIAPLALIYFNICDYMSSIHYSEKALELCSDLKSAITGTLYCCASIACFYEDQIDRSELYFELATSDHYISEDKDGSSWWYIYGNLNLVRVLFIYQKPEEIKKISDDLLQYAKEFSYPLAEAIGLYALAKASFLEQSYEKYESNLLTAKVIFEKYSYNFELADTNYDLGQFYLNTGNNDRGHSLLQEAIDLYTKMEAPKQIERVKKAFEQGAMK